MYILVDDLAPHRLVVLGRGDRAQHQQERVEGHERGQYLRDVRRIVVTDVVGQVAVEAIERERCRDR